MKDTHGKAAGPPASQDGHQGDEAKGPGLYVQLAQRDVAKIMGHYPPWAAGMLTTWVQLLFQACRCRSLTFTLAHHELAKRIGGKSRLQTIRYLDALHKLNLLTSRGGKRDRKTGRLGASVFKLSPAVVPALVPCTIQGEPCTTGDRITGGTEEMKGEGVPENTGTPFLPGKRAKTAAAVNGAPASSATGQEHEQRCNAEWTPPPVPVRTLCQIQHNLCEVTP